MWFRKRGQEREHLSREVTFDLRHKEEKAEIRVEDERVPKP